MKIRCDGTRRNNRHNFRAVHTNKDKPSRRRRALFQLEKKKVEKILHLLVIERGGSGEGNANTKRADRRRSKIFGQRKMWPDLLEQMLSTGQQGRRAANSYVYTKSMGHTRASNRHTTPPTHTGALSYPRKCVCVAGWLAGCVCIHRRKFSTVSESSSCIDRRRRHPKTGSIPFLLSIRRFGGGRAEGRMRWSGPTHFLMSLFLVIKCTCRATQTVCLTPS